MLTGLLPFLHFVQGDILSGEHFHGSPCQNCFQPLLQPVVHAHGMSQHVPGWLNRCTDCLHRLEADLLLGGSLPALPHKPIAGSPVLTLYPRR